MEELKPIEGADLIDAVNGDTESLNRYEVYNVNDQLNIDNIDNIKKGKKQNKTLKRINISYIYVLDILVIITGIATIIAFIIIKTKYKKNYDVVENIYLKPIISEHNYSKIIFKNGIIILLEQVHLNDSAGGAIAFDDGYLNNDYKHYKPGYLSLTLHSMIYDLKYNQEGNKLNKSRNAFKHLKDYLGKIEYSVEEDYSSFYFSILNDGFLKYLEYFAKLTHLEQNDKRLEKNYINESLNKFPDFQNNKDKRESHLLEFLIYGCKDKNESEILPQGNSDSLRNDLENNYEKIGKIMRGLLNSPSKIKIIFTSHYKFSLVRRTILRYFKIVFKNLTETQNKSNEYKRKDFDTNKIIYYDLYDNETNYLKINYYINNNNIDNKTQFHINSKYLNYIKYLLLETKNGSLYDELTNSTFNMSIKSISCDIGIILKSKIIFSIKIELNNKSYKHIKEIIKTVYEYIEKIKIYINNVKEEDDRAKELYNVSHQSFHFTEDKDNLDSFAQKAKKLLYLEDSSYFLKNDWFPDNFTGNIEKVKEYFEQLTMNNSVVILGINNYTKNKYFIDSDISFIFKNYKPTIYFNLHYTCNDLSKLNLTINLTEKVKTIGFIQNDYISKYTNKSQLDIHLDDEKKFFNSQTEQICSINSDTYRFFYFRDTSFKIPKVYISLFILHPFLRPNRTKSENENLFFQLMLFISYLKDEINYELADAIRAGNEFKVDFSENFVYLDIFCYSDIVYKILEKINEIILNSNTRIKNNYDIYNDYALETLNLKENNTDNRLELEFYTKIYDDLPIYNFYKFPIDKFKNNRIEINETLNSFIMQGYIYGYMSKSESKEICNIFKNSTINRFEDALRTANLNNGNVSIENFVKKLMNKKVIEDNFTYTEETNHQTYIYKRMSKYNYRSCVFTYIIEDIFANINSNINFILSTQKYVELIFVCEDKINCTKENILKKVINKINGSGLEEKVDLIGDRFYYYLKSTLNYIADRHDTLKLSSLQKSYENLYDRFNIFNEEKFDINFETFKQNILDLNREFPNYIVFE